MQSLVLIHVLLLHDYPQSKLAMGYSLSSCPLWIARHKLVAFLFLGNHLWNRNSRFLPPKNQSTVMHSYSNHNADSYLDKMVSLQGNLHQTSHYELGILDNSFHYTQSRKSVLVFSLDVLSLLLYRLRL